VPQGLTEQKRCVGGHGHLHTGQRLGGIPVRGEVARNDLQMQLHRCGPGCGHNRVDHAMQSFWLSSGQRHSLHIEVEILAPSGQDVLIEHGVARLGRHPPLVQMVWPQRRQSADHDQAHTEAPRRLIDRVQDGSEFVFKSQRLVSDQAPRRDVELNHVLANLNLKRLVVDPLQQRPVSHGRAPCLVDQIQLEFHPHLLRAD
jgi:hypothetical protein